MGIRCENCGTVYQFVGIAETLNHGTDATRGLRSDGRDCSVCGANVEKGGVIV